jgi:hypothetical protein
VLGIDHLARVDEIVDRCCAKVDIFSNELRERGFEISELLMAERSPFAAVDREDRPAPTLRERESRTVDGRHREPRKRVAGV